MAVEQFAAPGQHSASNRPASGPQCPPAAPAAVPSPGSRWLGLEAQDSLVITTEVVKTVRTEALPANPLPSDRQSQLLSDKAQGEPKAPPPRVQPLPEPGQECCQEPSCQGRTGGVFSRKMVPGSVFDERWKPVSTCPFPAFGHSISASAAPKLDALPGIYCRTYSFTHSLTHSSHTHYCTAALELDGVLAQLTGSCGWGEADE